MKYKFRLQSFLKLLQLKEDRKKMELGSSLNRIGELEDSLAKQGKLIRESLSGSSKGKELGLWMAFDAQTVLCNLDGIEENSQALRDEEDRKEMFRQELAELSSKREGIEKLRESDRKQFKRDQDKKEQKEIEDASRLFKRFYS